jgi:Domain of unknown function (DUF5615)
MSTIRYLCDEDVRNALVACMGRIEPGLEILAVGLPGAPPKGSLDPDLLRWAEQEKCTLLSRDKATMPDHVRAHLAAGRHTWGVFIIRKGKTWQEIADALLLIWSASTAEDWQDRIEWIPWEGK